MTEDVGKVIEELRALLAKATPQKIDTAENISEGECDCPLCDGIGMVNMKDFTNYDGYPLGIEFFGIGQAHIDAENLFRALMKHADLLLTAAARAASAPGGQEGWPGGVSDGLTLACSDCGQVPRFDYHVTDEFWKMHVPDNPERLSVVCLPCLDRRCNGVGLVDALTEIQWTGTGHTVVLKPTFRHVYTTPVRSADAAVEALAVTVLNGFPDFVKAASIDGFIIDGRGAKQWLREKISNALSTPQPAGNEASERGNELRDWKQAAIVEASLRREFLGRAEKAEAELDRCREALRPFAPLAILHGDDHEQVTPALGITLGDCRKARAALAQATEEK